MVWRVTLASVRDGGSRGVSLRHTVNLFFASARICSGLRLRAAVENGSSLPLALPLLPPPAAVSGMVNLDSSWTGRTGESRPWKTLSPTLTVLPTNPAAGLPSIGFGGSSYRVGAAGLAEWLGGLWELVKPGGSFGVNLVSAMLSPPMLLSDFVATYLSRTKYLTLV